MQADLSEEIAEYSQASAELDRTRKQMEETSKKLETVEAELARDQGQLNAFVVNAYQSGELDALETLLGATSYDDFLQRANFIALLGQMEADTVGSLKDARAECSDLKDQLDARSAELAQHRAQADANKSRIQAGMADQQRTLDSVDSDIARLVESQEKAQRAAPKTGLRTTAAVVGSVSNWLSAGSLFPGGYASVDSHPGRRYLVPGGVPTSYRTTGVTARTEASWYGNGTNGSGTSSGRPFNENELTCAHKTLPFGTLIAVSRGGGHVIVVVTDRGPFTPGRDIDLSKAAANAVGINGIGQVNLEIVVSAGGG